MMKRCLLLGAIVAVPLVLFTKESAAPFVQGHGSGQDGQWTLTAEQL